MAVGARHLGAVHYAIAKGFGLTRELGDVEQKPIEGETYVAGGYCETRRQRSRLRSSEETLSVTISATQRSHLLALTALAQGQGATVAWVTHPLPSDHLAIIEGLPALRATLRDAAAEAGVVYWDYNERLSLEPLADFMDFHHLNQRGVERFNEALLDDLRREGHWPP